MITLTFKCGGCPKEAEGTTWLRRRFVSISGKSYGIGHYEYDTAEDVMPEGWVAFDPWTGCTYCPECWIDLKGDVATSGAQAAESHQPARQADGPPSSACRGEEPAS